MLEEAEKVRAGQEPKAIIRDPQLARFVELPIIGRDFFLAGYSMRDVADGNAGVPLSAEFVFQAGQPDEITQAYRDAMGMDRIEEFDRRREQLDDQRPLTPVSPRRTSTPTASVSATSKPATGPPLVWLHGGGGLRLVAAHDAARRAASGRLPSKCQALATRRPTSARQLVPRRWPPPWLAPCEQLGLERFNLWGTSFGEHRRALVGDRRSRRRSTRWCSKARPRSCLTAAPTAGLARRSCAAAVRPSRAAADARRPPIRPCSRSMRALLARLPRPSRAETEARARRAATCRRWSSSAPRTR